MKFAVIALAGVLPVLARPGVRYRAAVVETSSVYAAAEPATLEAAVKVKLQNAAHLDAWTSRAVAKGAQIVVFGEDFGSSGDSIPAGAMNLYAEPLPSAPTSQSLCTGELTGRMPLARAVACTAKKYNITIATGLADLGPCVRNLSPFTQRPFPCDKATGTTAFNAIAVFGPDGNLLAKYHKRHLARLWSVEYEPWAEAPAPEVVTFDAPFGVRFGMFICNDINFGGPTRALLKEGVRDIIFPTLWINDNVLLQAVGMQDAFSRAHGVNLLAANGNEYGWESSGSGIWPASLTSTSPQYYTKESRVAAGEGWMGVADLVSPDPADSPLAGATEHPDGSPITNVSITPFFATVGVSENLTASANGLECSARVTVVSGSGHYALVAFAGLFSGGWYTATCAVVPCKDPSSSCHAMTFADKTLSDPLPRGGAMFSELSITATARHANTFLHSALCDGGLVVTPRSLLTFQRGEAGTHQLQLLGAPCPLLSAWVDGRAQSEDEVAGCPYNKYPCSTSEAEGYGRFRQQNMHQVGALQHVVV